MDRLGRLPAPLRGPAALVLRAITTFWRIRYWRTLRCGRDVVILGRLTITQGTRVTLGDRVRVKKHTILTGGGRITVGPDTLLNGCWLGAVESVTVGARGLLSDCCVTDSDFHNLSPEERHDPPGPRTRRPVVIGENVWIGAQAWVLKGCTIGDGSVVGTAAVVRGEVPARVVMAGNPAQIVKNL